MDFRNDFHSFGLLIVALTANLFWKPGFKRGIISLAVPIGVTFLIVRYLLAEFTNFSISNLSYAYEDIAISMLASPKAYIILITTAFIASHMNLKYGWEYNGIMIPSLLALVWYEPLKIIASVFEAMAVLIIASMVLRLPFFKKITMEGARKISLFASMSFLYKFLISYLFLWIAPEKNISDFYGFGYLLTTFMALKMHEKRITAMMIRTTLQTSFLSVVLASLVGFSLTFIPKPHWKSVLPGFRN